MSACPRCGKTECQYAGRWGSAFQQTSVSEWCLACGYSANRPTAADHRAGFDAAFYEALTDLYAALHRDLVRSLLGSSDGV